MIPESITKTTGLELYMEIEAAPTINNETLSDNTKIIWNSAIEENSIILEATDGVHKNSSWNYFDPTANDSVPDIGNKDPETAGKSSNVISLWLSHPMFAEKGISWKLEIPGRDGVKKNRTICFNDKDGTDVVSPKLLDISVISNIVHKRHVRITAAAGQRQCTSLRSVTTTTTTTSTSTSTTTTTTTAAPSPGLNGSCFVGLFGFKICW